MEINTLQLHSGSPKGRSRRKLDYYPTPPEVTKALMDFLNLKPMKVWECACGDLSMSKVIESYGHEVISTDIEKGTDYLNAKIECDAIITNPPFNLSADFISGRAKPKLNMEDIKKTSEQWSKEIKMEVKVLDPDGWDRANWEYSYYQEQITETEYRRRVAMSTVKFTGKVEGCKG